MHSDHHQLPPGNSPAPGTPGEGRGGGSHHVLPILNTPFCGDLRSKKFFLLDQIATKPEDYLDPSGHCWCYHTQQVVGPDGNIVAPEDCVPGRSCYRSALDKSKL
jgi:hypothetical protein